MLDLNTDFGVRVRKRLQEEDVIWFTCVSPRGVPSTNPVWFYWDGELILVYSQPKSYRVRNLQRNPNVTLNLQGADALGNNAVILNGQASLHPAIQVIPAAYWDKYAKFLPEIDLTIESMTRDYSVEIRVRPTRLHGE